MSSALKIALESLKLAAECGGEIDKDDYLEAYQALQVMIDGVVEHDREMDRRERSPEGDDYNTLLALLGLSTMESQNELSPIAVSQ
ncbi:hypothetical protein APB26_34325 [Pseudomonas aeruginosa]|uniref:hypothetical protein n=1 Tax=Pseudomonas aeruginosa TaxID=287 RepID=UPI00071B5D6A|nr:hypothetical protein [Pseudomonas aeruginosa]KSQ21634.2 hypothetical protein APB26_34325 [Pseudomonas aeruginosa]